MREVSFTTKAGKPKTTREQALRVARQLGCRGAHESHDGSWMPCASMEEFEGIRKGKSEYLVAGATVRYETKSVLEHRADKWESKSAEYYESREQAAAASRRAGCSGVRTVMLGGKRYYAPCTPRAGYEKLGERGVMGIATMPGGGLVSASVGGKSDEFELDEKFVNLVSRSTDPDVFSDPDSARIRARNMGCIGIRRYTARDGKTVWMPCSNNSDYRRLLGVRGDGMRRRNARKKDGLADGIKSATRPKKRLPMLSSNDLNMLAGMVREYNMDAAKPEYRTNLRDVRIVYLRGLDDGDRQSALARVRSFLRAMSSDKPLPKGSRMDFDLVPATHPSKDIPAARKKGAPFYTEGQIGFRQKSGCCPEPVRRYHALPKSED